MKMSFFEFQMTKLDHLVLEADAANGVRTPQQLCRLDSTDKSIGADTGLLPASVKKPS